MRIGERASVGVIAWRAAMESEFDDEYEFVDDADYSEPFGTDEWVLVCGYPGCCMPGYHFRSECHNAEDMEALNAEYETGQGKETSP
jgi:hypothetical protein